MVFVVLLVGLLVSVGLSGVGRVLWLLRVVRVVRVVGVFLLCLGWRVRMVRRRWVRWGCLVGRVRCIRRIRMLGSSARVLL